MTKKKGAEKSPEATPTGKKKRCRWGLKKRLRVKWARERDLKLQQSEHDDLRVKKKRKNMVVSRKDLNVILGSRSEAEKSACSRRLKNRLEEPKECERSARANNDEAVRSVKPKKKKKKSKTASESGSNLTENLQISELFVPNTSNTSISEEVTENRSQKRKFSEISDKKKKEKKEKSARNDQTERKRAENGEKPKKKKRKVIPEEDDVPMTTREVRNDVKSTKKVKKVKKVSKQGRKSLQNDSRNALRRSREIDDVEDTPPIDSDVSSDSDSDKMARDAPRTMEDSDESSSDESSSSSDEQSMSEKEIEVAPTTIRDKQEATTPVDAAQSESQSVPLEDPISAEDSNESNEKMNDEMAVSIQKSKIDAQTVDKVARNSCGLKNNQEEVQIVWDNLRKNPADFMILDAFGNDLSVQEEQNRLDAGEYNCAHSAQYCRFRWQNRVIRGVYPSGCIFKTAGHPTKNEIKRFLEEYLYGSRPADSSPPSVSQRIQQFQNMIDRRNSPIPVERSPTSLPNTRNPPPTGFHEHARSIIPQNQPKYAARSSSSLPDVSITEATVLNAEKAREVERKRSREGSSEADAIPVKLRERDSRVLSSDKSQNKNNRKSAESPESSVPVNSAPDTKKNGSESVIHRDSHDNISRKKMPSSAEESVKIVPLSSGPQVAPLQISRNQLIRQSQARPEDVRVSVDNSTKLSSLESHLASNEILGASRSKELAEDSTRKVKSAGKTSAAQEETTEKMAEPPTSRVVPSKISQKDPKPLQNPPPSLRNETTTKSVESMKNQEKIIPARKPLSSTEEGVKNGPLSSNSSKFRVLPAEIPKNQLKPLHNPPPSGRKSDAATQSSLKRSDETVTTSGKRHLARDETVKPKSSESSSTHAVSSEVEKNQSKSAGKASAAQEETAESVTKRPDSQVAPSKNSQKDRNLVQRPVPSSIPINASTKNVSNQKQVDTKRNRISGKPTSKNYASMKLLESDRESEKESEPSESSDDEPSASASAQTARNTTRDGSINFSDLQCPRVTLSLPPRKRGRPKGSKNRPKGIAEVTFYEEPPKLTKKERLEIAQKKKRELEEKALEEKRNSEREKRLQEKGTPQELCFFNRKRTRRTDADLIHGDIVYLASGPTLPHITVSKPAMMPGLSESHQLVRFHAKTAVDSRRFLKLEKTNWEELFSVDHLSSGTPFVYVWLCDTTLLLLILLATKNSIDVANGIERSIGKHDEEALNRPELLRALLCDETKRKLASYLDPQKMTMLLEIVAPLMKRHEEGQPLHCG